MLLACSGLLELQGSRKPAVSILCKAKSSVQHEALSLPTEQQTSCMLLSSQHLFAAGAYTLAGSASRRMQLSLWSDSEGPGRASNM